MARDIGGMGTMTSDLVEYGMWGPVDRDSRQRRSAAVTKLVHTSVRS